MVKLAIATNIAKMTDPVERLFAFAREREFVRHRKRLGTRRPWTDDEILNEFRFCNVYREYDKVTEWIAENWREPHKDDPDLWFAMCVARLFNLPETLADVGYPVPFNSVNFLHALKHRQRRGEKCFNGAYIVSTNGISTAKVPYLVHDVLTPLWKARERLRPKVGDSLNGYHMILGQMQGFGSFMTAQVIADLKYVEPLKSAPDWMTFVASGPGSRRGLNYVLGRDRKSPWVEDKWRFELLCLRSKLLPLFDGYSMPEPHAQDVQNLLCEWNKYWRCATEGKRPKQRYKESKK